MYTYDHHLFINSQPALQRRLRPECGGHHAATTVKVTMPRQKIVIVGSGWSGFTLLQRLDLKKFEVTVISPRLTSPYTPLLASAAAGFFGFAVVEDPVRDKQRPSHFFKAHVEDIDFDRKVCICYPAFDDMPPTRFEVQYDIVIIAPGCKNSTFGIPGVTDHAIFVKTTDDARAVRRRIVDMAEQAVLPFQTEQRRRDLLRVVIVGAGPTGAEFAAQLSDLFNGDFPRLYPSLANKVTLSLFDVAGRVLSSFDETLADHAVRSLSTHRVDIRTKRHVKKVEDGRLYTEEDGEVPFGMLIWATGNAQVPLVKRLKVSKHGRAQRIQTDAFLRAHALDGSIMVDVFALGDAADIVDQELPTTAEVACQKAEYLAASLNGSHPAGTLPFKYKQKALVAYLGQEDGVIAGRADWTGRRAWLAWQSKNFFWVRTPKKRVMVLMNWILNFVFGREMARM